MPISRKIVAQDNSEENQWLKVDHSSRFIQNSGPEWQFLFGINSALTPSDFVLKLSAKFDELLLGTIKMVGYLYSPSNATIGNLSTCTFKVFNITIPDWTEVLIDTFSGVQLSNSYFYSNPTIADLAPSILNGASSLMIECTATRLGVTYRDRVYFNHLGVYDSIVNLKRDINYLELTKVDE